MNIKMRYDDEEIYCEKNFVEEERQAAKTARKIDKKHYFNFLMRQDDEKTF